jgi:hypothetical protein
MIPKKTRAADRNRRALEILTNLFSETLKNLYTMVKGAKRIDKQ